MGAGIWLDTVLRRLRDTAGDRAARLRGAAAMTDIVERLRAWNKDSYPHNWEAADEIERLRSAMQSIARNTCCDRCQEAALVARRALEPKP